MSSLPELPAGSELQVNTEIVNAQEKPDVAMDADGNFVVVWESAGSQDGDVDGIFAQRYSAAGVAQGNEFQVNTYTTSNQNNPSVAMDAEGNFVVAWESSGQDGSGDGVFAQRYNAAGVVQGPEFRINTETESAQDQPDVAMDAAGNFVVVWKSNAQDGNSTGTFARRYNAVGVSRGSEFQVNTETSNAQDTPSVAMDADGNFVVVWESTAQDGSFDGIFAQRYNAAGVAQGSEFQVNTETSGNQDDPSVAMDNAGNFVVAWESRGNQDGDGDGVFAQRYNAAGVTQGSEFQVNTYTTSDQDTPSVAMDADGDFVIVWQSGTFSGSGQDGDTRGVFAQRYVSDGTLQGSEFQVNTYTTSNQDTPSMAMDADGDFVIAWESYGQDGTREGVFAQRYADPTVFDYDAQTYVDNGAMDFDRLATWPDASRRGLDAPVKGSDARLYSPFQPNIGDPFGDQPVVHYNGTDMGHAIPKDDALFGTPQAEKTLALVFRTSDKVTTRQMLVELGGEEAGMNAYLEGGRFYVGGWSQAGLPSDWGPAFFDTGVAARTGYVLVITHRRTAAGQPGRFEAYLDGTRIGLQKSVSSFAATNDNGGLGVVTMSTRLSGGGVSMALDRAKVNLGRVVQENRWLSPAEVASLTSELETRFGLGSGGADEAPVAASAAVPSGLELDAYPNPASGAATVRFGLKAASDVRVVVYDALGRKVAVLAEGVREAGWHHAVLSSAELASGVYVVRVEAGADVVTKRVTVLR